MKEVVQTLRMSKQKKSMILLHIIVALLTTLPVPLDGGIFANSGFTEDKLASRLCPSDILIAARLTMTPLVNVVSIYGSSYIMCSTGTMSIGLIS